MKKLLFTILTLTLCISLFAGCNSVETTEQNEGKVISPLPQTLDIDNLDDCTVFVSLEEGDAYVDDSGKMQMKVEVYTHDLYDMVDIASLEVGDTFVRLGENVEITKLERLDTGLIHVNGGEEMGGFDLYSNDSTVYYEMGLNDAKAFYSIGEITLPVSTEFVYTDSSNLDAEPTKYYPGDFLTDDADIEYFFIPNNTEIRIEGGYIVEMNRHYIP